ncbi:hypothetical protein MMC22_011646, partial [Lobaria immixta]|nr:hypothetical protein [Lobaria immixta]
IYRAHRQQNLHPITLTVSTSPIVSTVSTAQMVREASVVDAADAEEFDEFVKPPEDAFADLENEDPIDYADPSDDEYDDPRFAELVDGINLVDDTSFTAPHSQPAVVVSRREIPCWIQRRTPTNPLQDVTPTTKIISKTKFIEEGQKLLAFKPAVNAAPILQNDFK